MRVTVRSVRTLSRKTVTQCGAGSLDLVISCDLVVVSLCPFGGHIIFGGVHGLSTLYVSNYSGRTLFFEAIHERYEETVLKPSSSLPCCLNTPLDNLGPVNSCDLPEFYIFDYSQGYWVLQVWQDLATLWSDLFKKDDAYSSGSLKSKLIILIILYSFLQFLAYVWDLLGSRTSANMFVVTPWRTLRKRRDARWP